MVQSGCRMGGGRALCWGLGAFEGGGVTREKQMRGGADEDEPPSFSAYHIDCVPLCLPQLPGTATNGLAARLLHHILTTSCARIRQQQT